ncbi:ankyrin repeat domain-containing protein 30A-like isoform X1 [Papaver somniferum]|uniref:ankyrin repeat domain-containing protein 30A-like isoform X1 n=1 Tax=Papaver somniferum TaxID=3469 RepID=UPI000E6FEA77|nr:ankyrin repeat domain-containing protein 30A-like isoform X1 [Papaver somniferum]
MQTPKHQQAQLQTTSSNISSSFSSVDIQSIEVKDEEMSRSALNTFRLKEEEIEKKKMEVSQKVQAQLGRVEEETKRLAEIREELESLTDPTMKEVATVRKKIDIVNKELKPLGQTCQKKEKEYKDALEAFNEKNKVKAQLIGRLMEQLVSESEKLRMKKLEELSKHIDSMHL